MDVTDSVLFVVLRLEFRLLIGEKDRIVDRWDGVRFSLSGHAVSDRPRIV